MTGIDLYTIGQISDMLEEPQQRIAYIISKYRIKAVERIGIIRLFSSDQIQTIKQGLYGMQIRGAAVV